ncbi:MAG: glycosyltransferase family 9 protein [Candidatus Hydrogenedentes bacterium]|nr:glycosyltransferase family 9 protein [Candidatus Hydrogenedentota bacterium]
MLNGVPRILIIRFSAIGDVVRVLPALHALRNAYPHAQIDWAVEPKSLDIIADHPAIDQIHVFERPKGFWQSAQSFRKFCRKIRDSRYDMVLDFHGILKSGLVMRASRAKDRYAFAAPRAREMSHRFANHRVDLVSTQMNRIRENLELSKAAGAEGTNLDVLIVVSEEIEDTIAKYIHDEFQSGKLLAVVHAPVERQEKQWPLEYYAQLVDLLLADGRFEVILTWGPGQRDIAAAIQKIAKRNPHIAPETPDIKHYAGLVKQCDLFFGGDTGPMHIASAMDVPTVVVFGGTSPAKHHPVRLPSTALYTGPNPLKKNMTPARALRYLEEITPDMAYDACIEILK